MEGNKYLDYLSVGESEIEYKIRGLSSNQQNSRDILIICLQKESDMSKTVPQNSHIRSNPEVEAEYCQVKYDELNEQVKMLGISPSAEEVIPVYAKVIHWKGRCERLHNNFGNVGNIQNVASNFRRQMKWLRKLIIGNDPQVVSKEKEDAEKSLFHPSTSSSPNAGGGDVGAIGEQLQPRIPNSGGVVYPSNPTLSRTGTLRKTGANGSFLNNNENNGLIQANLDRDLNDESLQVRKQADLYVIPEHQPDLSISNKPVNVKTHAESVKISNVVPLRVKQSKNNQKIDKIHLSRLKKLLELVQLLDDDENCDDVPGGLPVNVEPVVSSLNMNQLQNHIPRAAYSIPGQNQQLLSMASMVPMFNQPIPNQQSMIPNMNLRGPSHLQHQYNQQPNNQPRDPGNPQYQYNSQSVNNNLGVNQPQQVPQPIYSDFPRLEYRNYDRDHRLVQRWNLTFNGGTTQNVLDFVYRIETLAVNDNYPQENLTRVLHLFLKDKANDWYWVYRQNHVVATWVEMREALISYFGSYDAEEETREQIIRRFQGSKETFSDFSLEIQKLNGRLREKMNDGQIINRLCHNMLPALRNVTLPYQSVVKTVEELRVICNRFEKMWEQTGYDPRRFSDHHAPQKKTWLHAFQEETNSQVPSHQTQISPSQNTGSSVPVPVVTNELLLNNPFIAAMKTTEELNLDNPNNLVCWNCCEKGHRYQDCDQSPLHVFCYGCGQPNILKPNCLKCQKRKMGNWWTNVSQPRESRSDPRSTNPSKQM